MTLTELKQKSAVLKSKLEVEKAKLDKLTAEAEEKFGTSDPIKLRKIADKLGAEIDELKTAYEELEVE